MKKLSLLAIGMIVQMAVASGQSTPQDSGYAVRKLHLDEVNFVSSYYIQNGNNSAVTGGVGTEHLTDFANSLELRFLRNTRNNLQQGLSFDIGIDTYTSASSDKIDPSTISSASSSDTRIYPSLGYSIANDKRGLSGGITGSFSTEYDYKSYGIGLSGSKTSQDKNREISARLQAYWDTWTVILPIELRSGGNSRHEGTAPRNSYSASFTYSQVLTSRLQAAVLVDAVYQEGLLATKYQRVYFNDNSERAETLPGSRIKLPLGARLNYFAGSKVVLRSYYRYYLDNWGLRAHTLSLEAPVKISPYLSVAPLYRFYVQTQADYFAPINAHQAIEAYYTSDYDLSAFQSHFAGLNVRYVPANGVLGIKHWRMAELRYGHYTRSSGLSSDVVTLNVQLK